MGDVTYFVEDAEQFQKITIDELFGFARRNFGEQKRNRVISIAYSSEDVVLPEGMFESDEYEIAENEADFEVNFPKKNESEDGVDFTQRFGEQKNNPNICLMDIRVDNGVYNDFGKSKNKIRNMIYQQLMTMNRIYGKTFRNRFGSRGPKVKFAAGRIAIATDNFCRRRSTNIHCQRKVSGASDYLNTFSR